MIVLTTTTKMAEMNKKNSRKTAVIAATTAVTAAGIGVGGTLLAKKFFAGKDKKRAANPAPENQDQVEATTPATEQEQPETNTDGDKK